ncbi:MAG: hypothetical protein ABI686_15405 [Acidobacteriota bacterium]
MLQTVEAEIDADGNVKLLEPLRVTKKARVIVTLLEENNGSSEEEGNSKKLLALLKPPKFVNRKSYSAEEIEAQIEDARNSWE